MAWYAWLILLVVLAVPGVLCALLYGGKSGAVSCIGCGECIRTGECVLVKKRKNSLAEKREKEEKPS